MKVALLSRAASPWHGHGGLERHVSGLRKHLLRAGVEVVLYTTPPASSVQAGDDVRFVPYGKLPWPRRPGFVVLDRDTNYLAWSLRAGRAALSEPGVDVVQADGGAAFGYAFRAGAGDPPLVLHPHGMEEFKAPALKRAAYLPLRAATRFAARRARRVLAPDAAMKDEVRRYLSVPPEKIEVVPNAIDLEAIDREPRAPLDRFRIDPEARLLLSVGRLEENKGFLTLVRALAEARSRLEEPMFWVLVGEGPERARLERAVEEAGLGERVRLAGSVSEGELAALYDRAALFVHPTLYEGSSMVTLEAMAHAKPVVATRVGGIPDKVLEGESGLLVPPGDEAALADAIASAFGLGEALEVWGRRARRLLEERFDGSRRVEDLLELYARLQKER